MMLLALLALLGGYIPAGMGAWDNGTRDPIPSSHTIHRYRYDNTFDAVWRDRIMFAAASLDYELPTLRLLYSLSDSPTPYQIHFDLNPSPAPATCSDDVPGGCLLGRTTCGAWGENAGTAFRVCNQFRVELLVNNIAAAALKKGLVEADYAHAIIRHELGHTLGLPESLDINGEPIGPCQRALIESYRVDESGTWIMGVVPAECGP